MYINNNNKKVISLIKKEQLSDIFKELNEKMKEILIKKEDVC